MEEIDKRIKDELEDDEQLKLANKIIEDSNDVSNLFLKFIENTTEYIKLYYSDKADQASVNLYISERDLMLSDARAKIKSMLKSIDEMDCV